MPAPTAELVQEFRARTMVPMMKCKQALDATQAAGDQGKEAWFTAAIDHLRKQGVSTSVGQRETAQGGLGLAAAGGSGAIIQLNCQTDFVSGNDVFKALVKDLAEVALAGGAADVEALKNAKVAGQSVPDLLAQKIQQLGENLVLGKLVRLAGASVVGYNHGGKIAALVAGSGDAAKLRMIALHVASANPVPLAVDRSGVDPAVVAKEREILLATPEIAAKPEAMRPKIVDGKLGRFFRENTLLEQEMLLDAEKGETVEKYAKRHGLTVSGFVRVAV